MSRERFIRLKSDSFSATLSVRVRNRPGGVETPKAVYGLRGSRVTATHVQGACLKVVVPFVLLRVSNTRRPRRTSPERSEGSEAGMTGIATHTSHRRQGRAVLDAASAITVPTSGPGTTIGAHLHVPLRREQNGKCWPNRSARLFSFCTGRKTALPVLFSRQLGWATVGFRMSPSLDKAMVMPSRFWANRRPASAAREGSRRPAGPSRRPGCDPTAGRTRLCFLTHRSGRGRP